MNRRRTTLLTGLAMAAVFIAALLIRIMPEIRLVGVGSEAPAFQAIDLRTGRIATLADYRGKVVLLNVWATYCVPCRVEMPSMERLSKHLAGTDFQILAVSVDVTDSSAVTAFARNLGVTFDILQDKAGAIRSIYQTTGVPENFVIDRRGVIVKKTFATEWDSPVNQMLIRRLLAER